METLLTAIGFAAVTAVAVAFHVRRTSADPRECTPDRRACPRCGASVPPKVKFCPGCGIPQQVFEVVGARTVSAEALTATAPEPAHAVVRADVCVGCGACVPVCPEPGAIRLDGKLAVVDLARCVGHGECVKACPVGGILMGTGDFVHRVEVPDVRIDFQTNVPGIYIAGELGGRGLIKNAINEGKLAAESAAQSLMREGRRTHTSSPPMADLAIVGSGPAGLSAALEAKRLGLDAVVLEQGTLADSIRKYPRHKILLAEPVHIPLYGDLWVEDSSKEALLLAWERIIAKTELAVRTGCRVLDVRRDEYGFVLLGEGFETRARRVVLAMGRRGTPRRLGVSGEESEKVFYDIVEMEAFQGRRVLVVGGGDSAVESAVGLSNQASTDVTLSYRGSEFGRVKPRNVTKIESAVETGRVRLLLGSQVREVRQESVLLESQGRVVELPNDDVVVRIGGDPPAQFLERIGVRTVTKEIPLEAPSDVAVV